MVYKVSFLDDALLDFDRISDFIAQDNPIKALEWIDMLEDRASKLSDNPRQGRAYKGDYRLLVVDRGYKIFYRVNDDEQHVYIIAIYGPQYPEKRMRG